MHLAQALGVGMGVVMFVFGATRLFFRGSSSEGLGTVSDRWVVQHRTEPLDE